jgi:hypothetical protein
MAPALNDLSLSFTSAERFVAALPLASAAATA